MPSLSAYLIISVISKIGKRLLLLRSSPSATRLCEIVPTIFINQFNVRNHAVLNAFNQLSCVKFIYAKPIFCLLSINSSACLDGKISFNMTNHETKYGAQWLTKPIRAYVFRK